MTSTEIQDTEKVSFHRQITPETRQQLSDLLRRVRIAEGRTVTNDELAEMVFAAGIPIVRDWANNKILNP